MGQGQSWISGPIFCLGFLALLVGIPCGGLAEKDLSAEVLQESAKDDSAYIIGPENFIQIRILGESDTQQIFRVDEAGYITHPLVGRIKVGGSSVAVAEQHLEAVLQNGYILNPNVTVLVLEHSRFSILGEVRNPGHYEILGQLHLAEAISMAGGFTPVANEKKVKIIRKDENGETKLEVNVEAITQGKQEDNVSIQAGDVISVSKSFF